MTEVAWFLEEPTPVRRHAAELLSDAAGVGAHFVDRPPEGGWVYVHHGTTPASGPAIHVPAHVQEVPPATVAMAPSASGIAISADIVEATGTLVTDAVHADVPPAALDRHGRLRAAASAQGARGLLTTPLVNRYAAVLGEALDEVGGIARLPRWPGGARAAIGLSHDVDRPDKYAILRAAGSLQLPGPGRLPWFAARTIRDLAHRLVDRSPNDFWLFDDVVAAETELGLRSTFLFSVMPAYGPYGSTNDVLYDAAWPHLRRAMRRLRERGIEIALHASYNAHRHPARFVAERGRLVELSEGPVTGLRHHFWQMGSDVEATLRAHEAAGFAYDSSIAFNDAIGLRRGIALPYRPWDAIAGRALETWQLPVIALDSAACAGSSTAEAAVDALWRGIEGVIAEGGLGVLDWHVRCSYPSNARYRLWAEAYIEVCRRLATRGDVWTTGLGEIAGWWASRAAQLRAG
jgi:hypothetical protein